MSEAVFRAGIRCRRAASTRYLVTLLQDFNLVELNFDSAPRAQIAFASARSFLRSTLLRPIKRSGVAFYLFIYAGAVRRDLKPRRFACALGMGGGGNNTGMCASVRLNSNFRRKLKLKSRSHVVVLGRLFRR